MASAKDVSMDVKVHIFLDLVCIFLLKGLKKLHLWLFLEESLTLVELSYVGT